MRAAMMRRTSNATEAIDEADSPVEGLEEGTLAIRSNTNRNITDIWQRSTRRQQPSNQNATLTFEIPYARVMPPDGENSNAKKYVVYDLSVRQDLSSSDPHPATIERRYTHFLNLMNGLRKDHSAHMQSVSFPKKVFMGNFSSDLIAARSSAFETFLDFIVASTELRESPHFLNFLQGIELTRACQLLDERRNEQAVPILENCFRLLNKVYTDKSKSVLLLLCRLVAACTTSPVPHPSAERWCELALRRYDSVSDADLLVLYVPLLQACVHLWWQRGRDSSQLTERLSSMELKGIPTTGGKTLTQAIHALDPRTETI